jgi:hypothetical protein
MFGEIRFNTILKSALLVSSMSCVLALAGCASGTPGLSSPGSSSALAIALTTDVTGSITNAQTFVATVAARYSGTASASGTVVVSSGHYASLPTPMTQGQAAITVPAALLGVGTDTLTATYMPPTAESAIDGVTASATVTVTSANTPAPVVTATPTQYAAMDGSFRAIQLTTGNLLVSNNDGIEVFTPTSSGGYQFACENTLPTALQANSVNVLGIALTPNGDDLAASVGNEGGFFFNNLSALSTCTATGVQVNQGPLSAGEGSFDMAVTADGKYAFIANEHGVAPGALPAGNVGVIALQYDANGNVTGGTTVTQLPTYGNTIAGVSLSRDGKRLYVTSESASTAPINPGWDNQILTKDNCIQITGGSVEPNGLLTVMDVAAAEQGNGSDAVLAITNAGCSPVRTEETADGNTLWVSARGDNKVLAFSTGMLLSNPENALIGYAPTGGTSPVALKLFDNDKLLAVANSNRFDYTNGMANATILSVAVPSEAAVVQTVQTGTFPREITLGQDGSTLFLTNYGQPKPTYQPSSLEVITTTVQ